MVSGWFKFVHRERTFQELQGGKTNVTLSLQYPESTTNMIPSTVSEVSAMFVATMHFLTPSGA